MNKNTRLLNSKSRSLKGLIVLAKIGRILSIVAFVLAVVVAVAAVVTTIYSYLGKDIALPFLDNKSLFKWFTAKWPNINYLTLPMYSIMIFIGAAAEAVVCTRAMSYFKHVIYADTPFTLRGSRELLRLGIAEFIALVATFICSFIVYEVYINMNTNMGMYILPFAGLGFGIAFVVISVITRYGAEQNRKLVQLQDK